MNTCVHIRPLEQSDSETSYAWRNDPDVWKYTGQRPDRIITPDIEREWIKKALSEATAKRFAICVGPARQYVGNVQLTGIDEKQKSAEFHLFIGERGLWGKGIATRATELMLAFARDELRLKTVSLIVSPDNAAAIRLYKKVGFVLLPNSRTEMVCSLKEKMEGI